MYIFKLSIILLLFNTNIYDSNTINFDEEYKYRCVGCVTSLLDGNFQCSLTPVAGNGFQTCTCSNTCQCTTACNFNPTQEGTLYGFPKNLDQVNIPEYGLMVLKNSDKSFYDSFTKHFTKKVNVDGLNESSIFIGEKYGLYKISEEQFILYPIDKDGNLSIFSTCEKENIYTISLKDYYS